MQIRMLSRIAGPKLNADPGDIINVTDAVADAIIGGGYGVAIRTTAPAVIAQAEEPKEEQPVAPLRRRRR